MRRPGCDAEAARIVTEMAPFRYAHEGPRATTPPPRIGENTDEVMAGLGYCAAEVAALHRDGVK